MRLYNTLAMSRQSRYVPNDPYRLLIFATFQAALQDFVGLNFPRAIDAMLWLADVETQSLMDVAGYQVDIMHWLTTPGLDRRNMVLLARLEAPRRDRQRQQST